MRRLDTDSVTIAETQINPSLLFSVNVVHDNFFRAENHVDVMDNNSCEIVGQSQQGGVLLYFRNDL